MQSSNSYLIFIKSTNLIHRLRCGPVQTATQERFELIKSRVYLSILINIIFFSISLGDKNQFCCCRINYLHHTLVSIKVLIEIKNCTKKQNKKKKLEKIIHNVWSSRFNLTHLSIRYERRCYEKIKKKINNISLDICFHI